MKKLFIFSYILFPIVARADWPMYRQNPMRTGVISTKVGSMTSAVNLRWEYTVPDMVGCMRYASPSLRDINGDGKMNIVLAASTQGVFAFSADPAYAELTLEWRYQTPLVMTSPLLFDVTGDGDIEVVFGSFNGSLYALSGRGDSLWSFTTGAPINSSPVAADIDSDGTMEVIFGSWDSYIYVLSGADGTLKWRHKTGNSVESSPAIADINGDGVPEIIIGSNDGKLYCLQVNAGLLEELWFYDAGSKILSTPAIGDINNDGIFDIVFMCENGHVYAINGAIQDLLWFFITTGEPGMQCQSAGLADINNDGNIEVVIGSFGDNTLYVIDGSTGLEKWRKTWGNPAASSPAIADINGSLDGNLEIVFATHLEYLYTLDSHGTELWKWRYTDGDQDCPPVLGDIDGDGRLEVVGADIAKSKIFVLDWPDSMAGIEERNGSVCNDRLAVYPNPFTQKTVISYRLNEKLSDYSIDALQLTIYDLSGRLVKSLNIGQGTYLSVVWDRTDDSGKKVDSGVYFCKLRAGSFYEVKKLIAL